MFRKKRWTAFLLTLMFVISLAYPAMAAVSINSVSLRITSGIEAGDSSSDVNVTTSNSRYSVEDFYITNEPSSGEWKKGTRPKIRITLTTDEESYTFKRGFSKSDISLSGSEATVSSVSRSSDGKLVVNVTLAAIDSGSGGYDLDVYEVQWDGDQGYGYWEGGEEAKRFEVKVYRGSSLLNTSTLTTTDTSFDFSSYITRSGTYTFRVRGVYNSTYKGSWKESDSWYVDSQTARDFREYNESTNNTPTSSSPSSPSSTPTGPSNSSSNSAAGPGSNSSTGAWLKDNVGWWYCNADRSYTVNNWQYINNKWYFFNERGYMVTGWVLWKNLYYYCGPDGDMWVNSWTPDGYYVDGNGIWVQGQRR